MRISENGVDLIKRFEGLELEAYQDIAGVWTIGYGHTKDVIEGQRISESEANMLLRADLSPREQVVSHFVKAALNQNQFDALVSLVYNIGRGAFIGSTCLKRLNQYPPDYIGAADALTWWDQATVNGVTREVLGLVRRRAAEKELFLTPVKEIPPTKNTAKIPAEKEHKPMSRLRCSMRDGRQRRNG